MQVPLWQQHHHFASRHIPRAPIIVWTVSLPNASDASSCMEIKIHNKLWRSVASQASQQQQDCIHTSWPVSGLAVPVFLVSQPVTFMYSSNVCFKIMSSYACCRYLSHQRWHTLFLSVIKKIISLSLQVSVWKWHRLTDTWRVPRPPIIDSSVSFRPSLHWTVSGKSQMELWPHSCLYFT